MPRKFNPEEEQQIRRLLRDAGREFIGRRGVRKTGIDELTTAAGISKGSFYRFYSCKEDLALELLATWEREFHEEIERRFKAAAPNDGKGCARQLAAVLLEDLPRAMLDSGLKGLFSPHEIAYLARQAKPEQVRLMDEQDIRLFRKIKPLFAAAGLTPKTDELIIIAGLRLMFEAGNSLLTETAKGPLQPDHYQAAFTGLLEGFIEKMFHESAGGGGGGGGGGGTEKKN